MRLITEAHKMEIVITAWALNSYLELKHRNIFSPEEYKQTLRPDVLLLRGYPNEPKFQNSKFWSVATDHSKNRIPDGFKMKWHNLGNGKIQMRLPVGMFQMLPNSTLLCEAYVKGNAKEEQRKLARFKTHLALIRQNRFTECGRLS